ASQSTPGDLDLFVRQHIAKFGPWVTSVQALAKIPLYSRSDQPLPGNARREYEVRLAMGRNVKVLRLGGFFNAELSYRKGTQGLSDQLRSDFTLGLRPKKWLLVQAKSYRTKSLGTGDGLSGSSYDLDKAEVSSVVSLGRGISFELGAGRDFAGQRVG